MRSEILQLLRTAPSSDDATAVAIVTTVDSSTVISQPHSCNSSASVGEAGTERIGLHSQPSGTTSSQGCPSTNNADDGSEHDPAESEEESSGGEDHPFDKLHIVDVSAFVLVGGHHDG
jgi:hypothetical protein